MTSWHSYPKVWNFGHAAITEIFFDEVHIEEKVDGSQFSFGMFDGKLKFRSKGREFSETADAPDEQMFFEGVEQVRVIADKLNPGWTYRGEYLLKPKHNVLAYDRTPKRNVILFDINTGHEQYLDYDSKRLESERLGLEVVPCLFRGKIYGADELRSLLDTPSVLGGQLIEGFVAKNYQRFGKDGKALLGKYVSERFKEIHKKDWKGANPGQTDIKLLLGDSYRTPARWDKAIQHLREQGVLENSPKDIGKLMVELGTDAKTELEAEIKQSLFDWAWNDIRRRISAGFPEFYKEKLLKAQFEVKDGKEM